MFVIATESQLGQSQSWITWPHGQNPCVYLLRLRAPRVKEWVGIVLDSPRSTRMVLASLGKERSHLFIWSHCPLLLFDVHVIDCILREKIIPLWRHLTRVFMSASMNVSFPYPHTKKRITVLKKRPLLSVSLTLNHKSHLTLPSPSKYSYWEPGLRQCCSLAGQSNHLRMVQTGSCSLQFKS